MLYYAEAKRTLLWTGDMMGGAYRPSCWDSFRNTPFNYYKVCFNFKYASSGGIFI